LLFAGIVDIPRLLQYGKADPGGNALSAASAMRSFYYKEMKTMTEFIVHIEDYDVSKDKKGRQFEWIEGIESKTKRKMRFLSYRNLPSERGITRGDTVLIKPWEKNDAFIDDLTILPKNVQTQLDVKNDALEAISSSASVNTYKTSNSAKIEYLACLKVAGSILIPEPAEAMNNTVYKEEQIKRMTDNLIALTDEIVRKLKEKGVTE